MRFAIAIIAIAFACQLSSAAGLPPDEIAAAAAPKLVKQGLTASRPSYLPA